MSKNMEPIFLATRRTLLRVAAFISIAGVIALGTFALYMRAAVSQDAPSRPLAVAVETVDRQTQYQVADYFTGRVEPRQMVDLSFEQPGKILAVLVEEGDRVQKNAIVAKLDTELLEASKAQTSAIMQRVKSQLDLAQLTESRQKKLWEQGHSTEQRYDEARLNTTALQAQLAEAEAAFRSIEINLEKSVLRAPFNATVGRRMADVGGVRDAGMVIVTLLENDVQQARISLPSARVATIKPGQAASMLYNGQPVNAEVAAIRADLNQLTRTQDVIFNIRPAAPIPFGELIDLTLTDTRLGEGYWVPTTALVEGMKGLWSIFVVENQNGVQRIARRSAEVIHAETSRVYITASLGETGLLVASGTHRVVPGQIVTTLETEGE